MGRDREDTEMAEYAELRTAKPLRHLVVLLQGIPGRLEWSACHLHGYLLHGGTYDIDICLGSHVETHSVSTLADALRDCTLVLGTTAIGHRELQQPLLTLADAAPAIRAHNGPLALLFGSEKFGLANDELAFCHHLIHIPTSPQTPSMNLGQAVAVCLYELIREPSIGEPVLGPKPVEGSDAEQITRMLLEVLRESGYTNRIVATSIELKVRRFVRRIHLTARDAPLVLGILRQILWKFRTPV